MGCSGELVADPGSSDWDSGTPEPNADDTVSEGPVADDPDSTGGEAPGPSSGEPSAQPSGEAEPTSQPSADLSEQMDTSAQLDEERQAADPDLAVIAAEYFPGSSLGAAPPRLTRLTQIQLDLTAQDLLPDYTIESVSARMPRDPQETNYQYAANLRIDAANFAPYVQWAAQLGARVQAAPEHLFPCAETDTACLRDHAASFVARAFRNVPSAAQQTRFVDFFLSSVEEVGLAEAARDLVDVTLTSPHFIFRDEVHRDAQGRLEAAQRLQHLTYALADMPPNAVGLQDAAQDYFASDSTRQQTVRQILDSPAARDKLARFVLAWLEIPEDASGFNLSPQHFPQFDAEVAAASIEELEALVEAALRDDSPSLRAVSQTNDEPAAALASLYGLGRRDDTLPTTERLGVFTRAGFIAAHSGPETTRLIKRGAYLMRKVACLEMALPPDGLDTTIEERTDVSERERIEAATSANECRGCHGLINPFGFILENYDAMGRYRERDEAGYSVYAPTALPEIGDDTLHPTAVEALRALTESARFEQCFTRQAFRFYTQQKETADDDPVLREVFFQFARDDKQDLFALLTSLATSPTFDTRAEAP